VIVSCDGAARGNPGPAGIGVAVVAPDGSALAEIADGIGVATNNVAEYTAAREGLQAAKAIGATDVLLRSDSNLLIQQLTGHYRVRNERLKVLHREVLAEAASFDRIAYEHVRRERNTHADRLANEGVDAWLEAGRPEAHSIRRRWFAGD